jgi:hypothetical protein
VDFYLDIIKYAKCIAKKSKFQQFKITSFFPVEKQMTWSTDARNVMISFSELHFALLV